MRKYLFNKLPSSGIYKLFALPAAPCWHDMTAYRKQMISRRTKRIKLTTQFVGNILNLIKMFIYKWNLEYVFECAINNKTGHKHKLSVYTCDSYCMEVWIIMTMRLMMMMYSFIPVMTDSSEISTRIHTVKGNLCHLHKSMFNMYVNVNVNVNESILNEWIWKTCVLLLIWLTYNVNICHYC